jgi:hypothetical protein
MANLYSDIVTKLKELEAMNQIEPTYGRDLNDPNHFDNIMERQNKLMDELKVLAKANQTIVGRTVRFPMADSYAWYVVTKVSKTTATLTWVKYCDAWQDDRIGYENTIKLDYVTQKIHGEDAMEAYFSKKTQTV